RKRRPKMLFTQTVTPECYTLIKDLMQIPALPAIIDDHHYADISTLS
ncbi:MAG: hypothetical protein JWR72_1884, partial [Flavisolibacter sp.]|nr:hypothetical protein [Flavisolibacter sp.]